MQAIGYQVRFDRSHSVRSERASLSEHSVTSNRNLCLVTIRDARIRVNIYFSFIWWFIWAIMSRPSRRAHTHILLRTLTHFTVRYTQCYDAYEESSAYEMIAQSHEWRDVRRSSISLEKFERQNALWITHCDSRPSAESIDCAWDYETNRWTCTTKCESHSYQIDHSLSFARSLTSVRQLRAHNLCCHFKE